MAAGISGLLLAVVIPCSAATNTAPVFPRLGMLWSTAAGEGAKADQWARYGMIVVLPDDLGFEKEAKAGWTSLLTQVRERCGDVPILVNAGWDSDDLDWVAPLINGIMYEDSVAHTEDKNPEKFSTDQRETLDSHAQN